MDRKRKHGGGGRRVNTGEDVIPLDIMSQSDDSAFFIINEAEWCGMTSSPLLTPTPTSYNRQESVFSFSEDGNLTSCTNAAYQDYQRQESNIHTPFDSDTALLFSGRKQRRFNVKKRLAAVWCAACVFQMCQYLSHLCTFDCSCRDQTGVHCLYRLKQKALKKLKVVQGALCVVTAIQSCMVFMPLATITSDFDGQCLLYSNLFIHWSSRNDTVDLDLSHSKFGSKEDCNFTTFINVVVTLVSLLFIWFFVHTSFVSGLEHVEVKLQFPFFLCCLVLLVGVIVSSFKITIGFNYWCYHIIINNPIKTYRQRFMCKDFEKLKWNADNRSTFYTYSVLAEFSTWLLTLTLMLQTSINVFQLYQNFKVAFAEIEIPHMKLKNSSESSDDEQTDWESDDLLLSLTSPVAPLPVYKVEYKKHQVLAKIVIHRDKTASPFEKWSASSTFILDKEKFRRNISSFERIDGLKQRRKVDFPLTVMPGHRRKQNWTGSCEELRSGNEFDSQIRRNLAIRSHEWHGFDADVNIPDENGQMSKILEWHADFGSQIHTLFSTDKFEWPVISNSSKQQLDGQIMSHEWHGFENDFVSHHKRSSSLPADWQHFDSEFDNHTTQNLTWSSQNVCADRNKDPWGFEQHRTSKEINDDLGRAGENKHGFNENSGSTTNVNVFDTSRDPFESDKR